LLPPYSAATLLPKDAPPGNATLQHPGSITAQLASRSPAQAIRKRLTSAAIAAALPLLFADIAVPCTSGQQQLPGCAQVAYQAAPNSVASINTFANHRGSMRHCRYGQRNKESHADTTSAIISRHILKRASPAPGISLTGIPTGSRATPQSETLQYAHLGWAATQQEGNQQRACRPP
jgi:hypothetical protein